MRQSIAFIIVGLLTIVSTILTKPFSFIHVPNGIVLSEPTQIEKFMDRIAYIETAGAGYQIVNKYGMMGRYQFSPTTVRAVGITATRQQFLQNEELQDTAMIRLMRLNERELSGYIQRYDGRIVKGVRVNRASILAGAHFAGANGVKRFLTNADYNGTVDGFGTSLRKYMSYFSTFHLPPISI